MDALETIDYRGYKIEIHADDNPDSPRDWDNLGTMVCWHRRYNLGDTNRFTDPDDFQEWLKSNPAIVLPLFLYDHSGLSISASNRYPYNDLWDAGQVGWIYVTKEKIKEEFLPHRTRVSSKMREHAVECLLSEVETYNDYLTGNVYGYVVVDPDGDSGDSVWGYYGYNHEKSGLLECARDAVDYAIQQEQEHYDKLQLRLDLAMV